MSKIADMEKVDWSGALGQVDVLTEVPEGYMSVGEITATTGNCYSAIQKKLYDGVQAGTVDRVDVNPPGARRKYYYKPIAQPSIPEKV